MGVATEQGRTNTDGDIELHSQRLTLVEALPPRWVRWVQCNALGVKGCGELGTLVPSRPSPPRFLGPVSRLLPLRRTSIAAVPSPRASSHGDPGLVLSLRSSNSTGAMCMQQHQDSLRWLQAPRLGPSGVVVSAKKAAGVAYSGSGAAALCISEACVRQLESSSNESQLAAGSSRRRKDNDMENEQAVTVWRAATTKWEESCAPFRC